MRLPHGDGPAGPFDDPVVLASSASKPSVQALGPGWLTNVEHLAARSVRLWVAGAPEVAGRQDRPSVGLVLLLAGQPDRVALGYPLFLRPVVQDCCGRASKRV